MSERAEVVVVGAGVGGLAAAIELARRGVAVTVVEKEPRVGGKMRQVHVGGRALDAGPTVLTMRWVFDELFEGAGTTFDDEVRLVRAERLARHAWDGGQSLDLFADPDRSADAIGDLAGASEARGFRSFTAYARRIFEAVDGPFLRGPRPGLGTMIAEAYRLGIGMPFRIDAHRTMWRALGDHFRDPRLRQLFGRYATYTGSSPFTAPATLNVVAHVELAGVWLLDGGMYALATALERTARRLGVTIRTGAPVASVLVDRGRAAGVRLASGEEIAARTVVWNGDARALAAGLAGPAALRAIDAPGPRSLSAVTWGVVARTAGLPLAHHNVFFSRDYPAEFAALERGELPPDPTVYVCAQDRGVDERAPAGGAERLFILVNAPARGDRGPFTTEEMKRCEERMLGVLWRSGLTLERTEDPPSITTPADFERLFPATGGALYGSATIGMFGAFSRPSATTRVPGLLLAGGSAHPGAGVPMAATSGRLAAASALEALASTSRSRTGATPGGTSTRSATTAATASR